MCRAGLGARTAAPGNRLGGVMRIHHARRGRIGAHRRHRRGAILPAILALVLAGLALTGIIATAAATHLSAMHYFG
jgi:hypothetical protein